MEGKAMLAVLETPALFGASLPAGEPVTLVIEEERFFGWVASEAQAHSIVCVAIEFTRGGTRVQERIPVENIQRLRDYLQAHRNYARRRGKEHGQCLHGVHQRQNAEGGVCSGQTVPQLFGVCACVVISAFVQCSVF